MKFKDFMDMYDNWNGRTRVNDNNLELILEDVTVNVVDNNPDLWNQTVVAFGFYDDVLTVRIK